MAEQADARDLKSLGSNGLYRFKSGLRHQFFHFLPTNFSLVFSKGILFPPIRVSRIFSSLCCEIENFYPMGKVFLVKGDLGNMHGLTIYSTMRFFERKFEKRNWRSGRIGAGQMAQGLLMRW